MLRRSGRRPGPHGTPGTRSTSESVEAPDHGAVLAGMPAATTRVAVARAPLLELLERAPVSRPDAPVVVRSADDSTSTTLAMPTATHE